MDGNIMKGKDEKGRTTIGGVVDKEVSDLLDAIVMADTHRSKSQLVGDAVRHYLEEHVNPRVLQNAKKILKIRHKTLNTIKSE